MNPIDELRIKYASHEYMKQRLEAHINHLPVLMKSIEEDYQKRTKKNQQLIKKRDDFIAEFMKTHPFSYIPQTEVYVDNHTISIVPEDYILHLIGSKLERPLIVMKFKITQLIIKKIREQPIHRISFDNFTVNLPFSKVYASYFLTILGDILLNKNSFIYYIDSSYKPFLKTLNQSIYCLLNKSVIDSFKHKYYEHKYELCRVISGTCQTFSAVNPLWVIIAALNLSDKYGSSDGFISSKHLDKAMILSKHTPESLIQHFLSSYLVQDDSASISYKDVYFLWKTFLKNHSLPFVVSQHNFKSSIAYLCDADMCMKLTPTTQLSLLKIKQFWDKYMSYDDEASYELQEIVDMYNEQDTNTINIETLQGVLVVEYPMINIDGTNVLNVRCSLWNKEFDMDNAMSHYDSDMDMYEHYLNFTSFHGLKQVSKDYFENYVSELNM